MQEKKAPFPPVIGKRPQMPMMHSRLEQEGWGHQKDVSNKTRNLESIPFMLDCTDKKIKVLLKGLGGISDKYVDN